MRLEREFHCYFIFIIGLFSNTQAPGTQEADLNNFKIINLKIIHYKLDQILK